MDSIIEFVSSNLKRIIGGIIGFVFGYITIKHGFDKALILTLFVILGVFSVDIFNNLNIREKLIRVLTKGD